MSYERYRMWNRAWNQYAEELPPSVSSDDARLTRNISNEEGKYATWFGEVDYHVHGTRNSVERLMCRKLGSTSPVARWSWR